MIFKKDDLRLGLVIGLLGPVLGLVVIYFIKYSATSFGDFLNTLFEEKRMITAVGSLSLLANVIFFTIYINTHRDKTAKGIFLITLIYGIGILVLKLVKF